MLQKGVYPYEYMDWWERFNETPLPTMKEFYSHLTMESITNSDYKQAKRSGKTLNYKIWANTMTCMYKVIP